MAGRIGSKLTALGIPLRPIQAPAAFRLCRTVHDVFPRERTMVDKHDVVLLAMAALVAAALPAPAAAQGAADFPKRPLRFVVPYAPAGTTDIMARVLGVKLAESLGQQVVVDNRPGAGGNIGADVVAKASPDGHTLLISAVSTLAIGASLYGKLP